MIKFDQLKPAYMFEVLQQYLLNKITLNELKLLPPMVKRQQISSMR